MKIVCKESLGQLEVLQHSHPRVPEGERESKKLETYLKKKNDKLP